jgi:hypothetical protein
LKLALQTTWFVVLVSGAWYGAGYFFLPPLLADNSKNDNENVRTENVTYRTLLFSKDPVPEKI